MAVVINKNPFDWYSRLKNREKQPMLDPAIKDYTSSTERFEEFGRRSMQHFDQRSILSLAKEDYGEHLMKYTNRGIHYDKGLIQSIKNAGALNPHRVDGRMDIDEPLENRPLPDSDSEGGDDDEAPQNDEAPPRTPAKPKGSAKTSKPRAKREAKPRAQGRSGTVRGVIAAAIAPHAAAAPPHAAAPPPYAAAPPYVAAPPPQAPPPPQRPAHGEALDATLAKRTRPQENEISEAKRARMVKDEGKNVHFKRRRKRRRNIIIIMKMLHKIMVMSSSHQFKFSNLR